MKIRSLFFVVSVLDEVRGNSGGRRAAQKMSELAARLEEMVRIEIERDRKNDALVECVTRIVH